MALTFHKMHGLGNDFVLLDLRHQDFPIDKSVATQLADRHTGIGCDQVLVLREPLNDSQLASFEVWNTDGSKAEQCGNGVRCLGLYLHMRAETPRGRFLLGGPVNSVEIECLDDGQVRVNMGQPVFEPKQIPVELKQVNGWYSLDIGQESYSLGAASMGNPHALMVVEDIETTDVAHLGAAISSHPAFPRGCNAGFVQLVDRENIRLRVYERGAAETRACGSGACAAMSILRRANLLDQTVNVTQRGGNLILSWTGGADPVIMKGSATHVFEGKLDE
jgi:diaminopimelate epimerase